MKYSGANVNEIKISISNGECLRPTNKTTLSCVFVAQIQQCVSFIGVMWQTRLVQKIISGIIMFADVWRNMTSVSLPTLEMLVSKWISKD